MKTCPVCAGEVTPNRRGRPRIYCSEVCQAKSSPHLEPLPEKGTCPTCQTDFKPGRRGGVIQRYCNKLCNPKYSDNCTQCGARRERVKQVLRDPDAPFICNSCRGVTPQALQTCTCILCGKEFQRRRGGIFCSAACGYRHSQIHKRDLRAPKTKRTRPAGVVRPLVDGQPLIGPQRKTWFSVHDGKLVTCPGCAEKLRLWADTVAWCDNCNVEVELLMVQRRKPTPVAPSPGPTVPPGVVDHRKRLEELRDVLKAAIDAVSPDRATLDELKLLPSLSARYQAVLTELAGIPEVKDVDGTDELRARRAARRAGATGS